jgi:NAD(P)-dependent dehydrogenase (short-subunit alcohol dehydrogenase family)
MAESTAGLADRVGVITGGASGIGLATARRLVAGGGCAVLVDLNADAGAAAEKELGDGARFVAADVGDAAAWPGIVERAIDAFGGIDFAYLNAGVITGEGDITALTDAQYRRIMGPNVDGVVFGVRAVVPSIAARGGGAIVVTASLAGLVAFSPDPIYTLTKHAVIGLVRALAPQLEEKGITINAVCPGMTATPLVGDEGIAALRAAGFPLIDPEQIADAAIGRMLGRDTGRAWVCQAGREAVAYEYRRVPGPRVEGQQGMAPPGELTGWDQRRD